LPFAVEASISIGKWSKLDEYLKMCPQENVTDFTIGISSALNALRDGNKTNFHETIQKLRLNITRSMTTNSTMSLQSCHDELLQLHALSDVEAIVNADTRTGTKAELVDTLDHRLGLLGVYISEKQYLLGLRRAAMELSLVSPFFISFCAVCLTYKNQDRILRTGRSRCLAHKCSSFPKEWSYWTSL
jgi:serine/threonine-protein kinase ATR